MKWEKMVLNVNEAKAVTMKENRSSFKKWWAEVHLKIANRHLQLEVWAQTSN